MRDRPEKRQKTRPKKGKPIEIPVPKREDFDKLLDRAASGSPPQTGDSEKGARQNK
jgi:hypothetical protein